MNLGYALFMAEQEGFLDTREGRINAAIKEFKQYKAKGYNINDPRLQEKVLSKYKLNHNLSNKESRRIAQVVCK